MKSTQSYIKQPDLSYVSYLADAGWQPQFMGVWFVRCPLCLRIVKVGNIADHKKEWHNGSV